MSESYLDDFIARHARASLGGLLEPPPPRQPRFCSIASEAGSAGARLIARATVHGAAVERAERRALPPRWGCRFVGAARSPVYSASERRAAETARVLGLIAWALTASRDDARMTLICDRQAANTAALPT
jgi:hypothetical protein